MAKTGKTDNFVQNFEGHRLERQFKVVGGYVGEPRETEWYTKERLESEGVVGLYRSPRGLFDPKFAIVPQ